MPRAIVCPSGLAGEVRGLTGKEGKLLADRTLAKSGVTIDRILQSCWLSTSDPGIYEFEGAPDWSKVLVGDRFYALVQIRRCSFGDDYAFSVQCESAGCRERFEWELDVGDLPVRALTDEAKATCRFKRRRSRGWRRRARPWLRRWSRRRSARRDWMGRGCCAVLSRWMSSPALAVQAAGGGWHT